MRATGFHILLVPGVESATFSLLRSRRVVSLFKSIPVRTHLLGLVPVPPLIVHMWCSFNAELFFPAAAVVDDFSSTRASRTDGVQR
jgi:hypothetical protein